MRRAQEIDIAAVMDVKDRLRAEVAHLPGFAEFRENHLGARGFFGIGCPPAIVLFLQRLVGELARIEIETDRQRVHRGPVDKNERVINCPFGPADVGFRPNADTHPPLNADHDDAGLLSGEERSDRHRRSLQADICDRQPRETVRLPSAP